MMLTDFQGLTPLLKITVDATRMEGGEVATVFGRERLPNIGDRVRENISIPRRCIRLDTHPVSGGFHFERFPRFANAIFRIRGMWDMYRQLPVEMVDPSSLMDTTALFEVSLNGHDIYRGRIGFLNSRRWRFWPSIDIPFPMERLVSGMNHFTIRNLTPPFRALKPVGELSGFLHNTAYQISDIQVILLENEVPSVPILPEGTFIGHLIGGHSAVHLENDNLRHSIDQFCLDRQGNLMALLMRPGKTSYDLDLDRIDTTAIIKKGLKVVLRYYGDNDGGTIPRDEYIRKLRDFVTRLGDNFLGFAPHEEHQAMTRIIKENRLDPDISVFSRHYVEQFSKRVARIREIAADAPLWDTDPTLYSHFHLQGGADFPAIEHCLRGASLDVASARGTAKTFGHDGWAAINSFECQAWGGLGMLDQEAGECPFYEQRRADLWWLTQHLLYLGGARVIYSESGIFEHRVTLQREFDDPHLEDLRASQTDLIRFASAHPLQGQPLVSIAYLQGRYDIFKGTFFTPPLLDAMGPSLYSWKNLEVCFPSLHREIPGVESLDAYLAEGRALLSETPYGNVDIVPAIPGLGNWNEYTALVASGWHTMDRALCEKLEEFVYAGGTFIVLLPQLTMGTQKADPCAKLDWDWLAQFAGVRLSGPGDCDVSLRDLVLTSEFQDPKFPKLASRLRTIQGGKDPVFTRIKNLTIAGKSASVVLEDRKSTLPFLVRNDVGRGSVYLFNIAEFPSGEAAYLLFNAAIQDVFDALPLKVRLRRSAEVSFTLYPRNIEREEYRLFVVNTAWYSQQDPVSAEFEIFGQHLRLEVPRRKVVIVDLSPGKIEVLGS